MKSFAFALVALLAPLAFVACGETFTTGGTGAGGSTTATTGTTTTTSTTGAGGGTTSTTGSGGGTTSTTGSGGGTTTTGAGGNPPVQSGDCDTNADCPGSACKEVTPGGYRVCFAPIAEITTCAGGPGGCCKSEDCPPISGEKCFPPYYYCGGIVGPMNQCLSDGCQSDSDCKQGNAICVKAGILGRPVNSCMPVGCKHDSDCGAAPGGKCQPVESTCCGEVEGLYCVYAGTGCRRQSDCPGGHCANDGQKSYCQGGSAACPL